MRTLFVATDETVGDGIAGLPVGGGGAGGGGSPPPGEGLWSGDGTFALDPSSSPETRSFSLTNIGTGPLTLGSPAISGSGAAFFQRLGSTCGGALPPGDSCEVLVQASAAANGTAEATLSIGGVPGGVALSRTATGFDPNLVWSGTGTFSIDGTPPATGPFTAQQTFLLQNLGFGEAPGIAPALSGPNADAFALSHDCPATLPSNASCTVTVTATAEANGSLVATLVAGGPASEDQVLTATASGFAPLFAWSGGGAFTLTAPTTNPEAVPQVFTLTNIGTAPGVPPSPSVSGDAAGYTLAVSAPDCGASLPVGGTCEATVTATFTDNVAALAGTLSSGAVQQALTGSATGFAPAWAFDPTPAPTFAIVSPPSNPGTQTLTFTLRNTGTLAGTVPARSIAGPNAADFPITGGTCAAQTLAPNATCTVQVTFTASADVAGRAATLSAGTASLALSGSATGVPPCAPGNTLLTAVGSGTFTRPPGTEACAFRVLVIGGGGAGFISDVDDLSQLLGGPGGGSGQVAQATWAAGTFPASVSYTVGAGAPTRTGCSGTNAQASVFGATTAPAGTNGGVSSGCGGWYWFGTFAGTGGSSGGNRNQSGGSNGALVAGSGAVTSQGAAFGAALVGFTQATISAGAGGAAGISPTSSRRGGGGGGGVVISLGAPAVAAAIGGGVGPGITPAQPGQGFGAGGAGANHVGVTTYGGQGASGGIYIEWSLP